MIRCVAVDDELLSLELLEDNIRRIPFLHLVGRCFNAYEALEILRREPVDLIFLDIQMGGITGMQFLQSLSTMAARPMVIFVTAYKKYALDGFDLDVLDYLVKPVAFERFLKAVNKAAEYHALKTAVYLPATGSAATAPTLAANASSPSITLAPAATFIPDYLFVNVEYNLVKIEISQICFIEGLKDYIKIYKQGVDKPIITRLPMKSIAEKLPPNSFVRIHKSYIIAVDKISSIRKNRIYLQQHIIPISDSYRDDLFRLIDPQKIL
ncbi:LytR/AlgR family response regulator transcription factor [Paraflavitalea pollutisoli]|uniref:LytR/AlgR family response regulator transcription factor n=1 Tax=Paraflavitalea pollutisoli TaxID=3034143 RepID=UPI0023ED98BE|nr:LytTR family DNA-binding domain-containing protein [Paraflavitalea sp. H1-2-19X]